MCDGRSLQEEEEYRRPGQCSGRLAGWLLLKGLLKWQINKQSLDRNWHYYLAQQIIDPGERNIIIYNHKYIHRSIHSQRYRRPINTIVHNGFMGERKKEMELDSPGGCSPCGFLAKVSQTSSKLILGGGFWDRCLENIPIINWISSLRLVAKLWPQLETWDNFPNFSLIGLEQQRRRRRFSDYHGA